MINILIFVSEFHEWWFRRKFYNLIDRFLNKVEWNKDYKKIFRNID